MLIEDVAKLSPIERFIYWIRERETIRLKKQAGQLRPYTLDTILQSYRFCNVRRMDDKVSKWLYTNWYKPHFNHKNMLLACALARLINKPTSLAVVGFPLQWRPKTIKRKLREIRDSGKTVFNAAYMIRGNNGIDKIESVVTHNVQPLLTNQITIDPNSMEKSWEAIRSSFGFGSFMAGQVVADLRWAVKGKWGDKNTWACAGPGSIRGMNRLLERDIKTPIKQEQFLGELLSIIKECKSHLPGKLHERLEAHDYQNCLCEFDKYERTLFDGRKPKQRYPGT